jgi:MYXO-CTERM domain-containing protein
MRQLSRAIRAALIVTAAAGLLVVAQATADAACSKMKEIEDYRGKKKKVPRMGKPERRFRGKVLTSSKSFPTSARSESAYIAKVRKHTKSKFWEDKEKKEWKIYFIAFFKAPLDSMEVRIRIHDITNRGGKRMLSSFDQFVDRCATSYASNMVLKRERFGVNKKLLVTVETIGGTVLSSGKIEIRGEADKFTGKADFSDEIPDKKEPKAEEPKEEKEPEVAELPEEEEEELDLNDKSILNAPDLSYSGESGDKAPQETEKKSGCGCRADREGAAGSWALAALVLGLCVVRRRTTT